MSFLKLLYTIKHTFALLCTKYRHQTHPHTTRNAPRHAAPLSHRHKWDSHSFLRRSHSSTDIIHSNLDSSDWRDLVRKVPSAANGSFKKTGPPRVISLVYKKKRSRGFPFMRLGSLQVPLCHNSFLHMLATIHKNLLILQAQAALMVKQTFAVKNTYRKFPLYTLEHKLQKPFNHACREVYAGTVESR